MLSPILVTGATGKQGSAVIKALSALGNTQFTIFALTRNARSIGSQSLVKHFPSVRLVTGDLNNPNAIFESLDTPIWGVFSVQTPYGKEGSLESEVTQGKRLVDAALKHNVKYFVYSSVDRGGPNVSQSTPCPVPHFETKRQVENHLRARASDSQMRYTILRPTFFMENLTPDMQGKLISAAWKANVDPKRLQLVATSDIGHFAAQAFANPEKYAGQNISIAGDELSHAEASAVWKQRTGSPMPTGSRFLASALLMGVKDLRYMFKWFREVGYGADISDLRRQHPELQDFATWVKLNRTDS